MLFRKFAVSFLLMASSAFAATHTEETHEECGSWSKQADKRSNKMYSTWVTESEDSREALTTVGNKITISPRDFFDKSPEIGQGKFDEQRLINIEDATYYPWAHAFIITSGRDTECADFAKQVLGTNAVEELVVPLPTGNLVGIEMTIVASKTLLKNQDMVLCHEVERGAFACHEADDVDFTEVTVAPNSKKDVLWVACHNGEGCHVMNAGDKVFKVAAAEGEIKMTIRGSI